jgi:hypothetical protein
MHAPFRAAVRKSVLFLSTSARLLCRPIRLSGQGASEAPTRFVHTLAGSLPVRISFLTVLALPILPLAAILYSGSGLEARVNTLRYDHQVRKALKQGRMSAKRNSFIVRIPADTRPEMLRVSLSNASLRTLPVPTWVWMEGQANCHSLDSLMEGLVTPQMTDEEKALAVFHFFETNWTHLVTAPGCDSYYPNLAFAAYSYSLCGDTARMAATMLEYAGLKSRVIGVQGRWFDSAGAGRSEHGHAFTEALVNGRWVIVDCDLKRMYRFLYGDRKGQLAGFADLIDVPHMVISNDDPVATRFYANCIRDMVDSQVYGGSFLLMGSPLTSPRPADRPLTDPRLRLMEFALRPGESVTFDYRAARVFASNETIAPDAEGGGPPLDQDGTPLCGNGRIIWSPRPDACLTMEGDAKVYTFQTDSPFPLVDCSIALGIEGAGESRLEVKLDGRRSEYWQPVWTHSGRYRGRVPLGEQICGLQRGQGRDRATRPCSEDALRLVVAKTQTLTRVRLSHTFQFALRVAPRVLPGVNQVNFLGAPIAGGVSCKELPGNDRVRVAATNRDGLEIEFTYAQAPADQAPSLAAGPPHHTEHPNGSEARGRFHGFGAQYRFIRSSSRSSSKCPYRSAYDTSSRPESRTPNDPREFHRAYPIPFRARTSSRSANHYGIGLCI